jgi:hypothetical protein
MVATVIVMILPVDFSWRRNQCFDGVNISDSKMVLQLGTKLEIKHTITSMKLSGVSENF